MRFSPPLFALTLLSTAVSAQRPPSANATPPASPHVQVVLDTIQAAVALDIIEWNRGGNKMADDDWRPLFISDGMRRLKLREAETPRAVIDSTFKLFLLSDTLAKRAPALRTSFESWKRAGVKRAVSRAVAYLPPEARVTATVYIMIKPFTNTFVLDVEKDPALFVYLDTKASSANFENTVAHELHHMGFATIGTRLNAMVANLPDSVVPAAEWTRAFGEGFAMLAAAGSPDVNAHATSSVADRTAWNRGVASFNRDLKRVEEFLLGIVTKKLTTPDQIVNGGNEFYGVEGPWYTVGWKMAATIEKQFGRKEVIECMIDPHRLLDRYNAAATIYNKAHPAAKLALWSPMLVKAFERSK